MKKIFSIILIVALVITMSNTAALAEDSSMFVYGRLKDCTTFDFGLDCKSKVCMHFQGEGTSNITLEDVGITNYSGDNTFYTSGRAIIYICNEKGNKVYQVPKTFEKFDYTDMDVEEYYYETSLDKGKYKLYIKNAYPDYELFHYVLNMSWNAVHEDPAPTPSINQSDKQTDDTDKDTTSKPSTNTGTSATKPSTDSNTQSSTSSQKPSSNNKDNIPFNEETEDENPVAPPTFSKKMLVDATEKENNLTINSESGALTFDKTTLKAIASAVGESSDLSLEFREVSVADLNSTQSEKLKDVNVAMYISAEILADGEKIHDFGGGKVIANIPFRAPEGTSIENYTVIYISNTGEIELINTTYGDGKLIAEFEHFSHYAIVKTDTIPTTSDGLAPDLLIVLVAVGVAAVVGGVFVYKKKTIK